MIYVFAKECKHSTVAVFLLLLLSFILDLMLWLFRLRFFRSPEKKLITCIQFGSVLFMNAIIMLSIRQLLMRSYLTKIWVLIEWPTKPVCTNEKKKRFNLYTSKQIRKRLIWTLLFFSSLFFAGVKSQETNTLLKSKRRTLLFNRPNYLSNSIWSRCFFLASKLQF